VPKKTIPCREQEVCVRLKEIREALSKSQEEFGEQIGITRQRLASYEELRAPLRADLALRLCRQFIISEEWLATGKGWSRQCLDLISEPVAYQVPVDAPFGTTWDKFLAPVYARIKANAGGEVRLTLRPGDNYELMLNLLLFYVYLWVRELPAHRKVPEEFQSALCAAMIARGKDFIGFVLANERLPWTASDLDSWLEAAEAPVVAKTPPVKKQASKG